MYLHVARSGARVMDPSLPLSRSGGEGSSYRVIGPPKVEEEEEKQEEKEEEEEKQEKRRR